MKTALIGITLIWLLPPSGAAAKEKMKPEEVVARHLESLGPVEARAEAGGRHIEGSCRATFRLGGSGQIDGTVQMVSEGIKTLLKMEFSAFEYPHERMAFDGTNLAVDQVKPGVRSPLGQFLYTHAMLLRQGLIGGTLSSAWPLLDVAGRNPQLQYAGTRKLDNRQVHELRYRPRKDATDVQVSLLFEDGTFRHVRSQYRMTITALMGARPEDSASQRETRYLLVEDFSDYRLEGKLMLPHRYAMQFTIEGTGRTILSDWVMQMTRFAFNQPTSPKDFILGK